MSFSDPAFAALVWDRITHKGQPVDLAGYRETWRDNCSSMANITGDDRQLTGVDWYAPGRTDHWGPAAFRKPTAVPSPFSVKDGRLFIKAEKLADGTYQSGHMQGVNNAGVGSGHVQAMGYWEARIGFAKGAIGCWPAFWLLSKDPSVPRVEIDVVEAYGGDPAGHHSTIHLAKTYHPGAYTKLNGINAATGKPWYPHTSMFDGVGHVYGCMIDEEGVKVYYDGLETARFPMTAYFRTGLYMLVSHALYDKDIAKFVSPKVVAVDYVRTMQKP